jgi:hypothetical protein
MHSLDVSRRCADAGFIAKLNSKGAAAMSSYIKENIEGTAEWRRRKAEEFPDDARNLKAAEELDRLAEEVGKLEGSELYRRIDAMIELAGDTNVDLVTLCERESEELRHIGFHSFYESGAEFLQWYHDEVARLLQRHKEDMNDDDDSVSSPGLAAQVENNEAVKAAKRAYDEIYAKAYAEARKRL